MDVTDAVKNEVFRPLTTVAIPGAIAVAPYVILAQHYIPKTLEFWHDHDAAFSTIVVACMIAAGLLLEDVGALLEDRVIDALLEKWHPGHRDQWSKYLQLQMRDEYVGQRYLRTMVTRLKFELSMLPALLMLWGGLGWIQYIYRIWPAGGFLLVSLVLLGLCVYLAAEAYMSAKVLMRTRALLIEAVTRQAPSTGAS